MADFLQSRTMKGGGLAVGTLIFLGIVVALQYIAVENPKRWDLTTSGKHTLAPQSVKLVETFREKNLPLEVLAFYETKDQQAQDETQDLLERYRDVWKSFNYTFYDPDRDRAIALQNNVDTYPTLTLKAGDKSERLNTIDEESVTNALMKLLRKDAKKIYFLKGHGELDPSDSSPQGFAVAKEQIEKQNYKTEELVLLQTPEVPHDATILMVAGPKTDPMENEIKAIQDYVHRGGSLFVLINPFQTPKLSEMLVNFGFQTASDIVVDRMSQALGGDYLMPVITTYAQFPITKGFTVASFFPQTRSVRVISPAQPNIQATELAKTSPVSWTIDEQQLKSGVADFDEKTGQKGPIPVMSVSTITVKKNQSEEKTAESANPSEAADVHEEKQQLLENKAADEPSKESEREKPILKGRVVVAGSSLFAANRFFKLQGNGDLFLNTVSWLAEDENLVAIRPKSQKAQPVVLTGNQSLISFMVPVVLIPMAWIIAGICVFLYRRKLARMALN
jgi:ABC-type uncharacterized transport system involved in gliding motility auxiliary subunit